ncbi:hypothetical protein ACT8ZV_22915 [Nocardioides sp. MAHUQ-72]|uniref:hypothetical protein n=1 Tax=unclassified Nocardioides TaxID=2615069 RepID=UPI00360D1D45
MSDQLTAPPARSSRADRARSTWSFLAPYAVQAVLVMAILAAVGALAGVVWEWWWSPPVGVVVHHHWLQDEEALRGSFDATGTYVVVAAVAGLLAGAVVALLLDRSELVTLVAVLAGSLLGGWLMYRVGVALGPADPRPLAETAADGTRLPARLVVSGLSPRRVFPGAALLGVLVVFLGFSRRRAVRD